MKYSRVLLSTPATFCCMRWKPGNWAEADYSRALMSNLVSYYLEIADDPKAESATTKELALVSD